MGFAHHSFFLQSDGTVKACGYNADGELGIGNTTQQNSPVTVPISNVKQIACGGYHTFFLLNDGTVKACGYNYYGQLGIGNTTNQTSLVTVPISNVKQIACGWYHTFFLLNDGTVKACGRNDSGQLGIGNTTNQTSPVTVPISNVKQITCGGSHTFFLLNDGTVKACGHNGYGNLGIGNTTNQTSPVVVPINNVKQISCSGAGGSGSGFTFFLLNDGTVKACGANSTGQLGIGNTINQVSPVTVPISNVKLITTLGGYNDVNDGSSIFLLNDGTVKACGANAYGQLGIGNTTNQVSPVTVQISNVKLVAENYTFLIIYPLTLQEIILDSGINLTQYLSQIQITQKDNGQLIRYAVSKDKSTWWVYRNGWQQISDITNGMTKTEIEAITLAQWKDFFQLNDKIYLLIVMKTNDENVTPVVDKIQFTLNEKYEIGETYLSTSQSYDTTDWKEIENISISVTTPTDSDIRFAFSIDKKNSWIVYNGGWQIINDLKNGMTKTQVEALTSEQLNYLLSTNILDVGIYMYSNNEFASPTIDQFTINYTKVDGISSSIEVEIPVPEKGYRNVLVNDTYTLKLAEGLAFDSSTIDYDFYTTADRIIIKPLEIGTVVGGRTSNIYSFEVINTYENYTMDVTLKVAKNDVLAKEMTYYALLPDAENDDEKTKVQLSLLGGDQFTPIYPLTFRLRPLEKRVVFIRIQPTITTSGTDSFQVIVIGRPV